MELIGQAKTMIWLLFGTATLLYLLFWPFSLRFNARLSPACGRAEITVASLVHLRFEGDFLQPPYLTLWRLDREGRRRPLSRKRRKQGGFSPVVGNKRLSATLYVGLVGDGALTVESLGLLYSLLEALGRSARVDLRLRPVPCFDKDICALRLSGIGCLVPAQNILEYLKGKYRHANR